MTLLDRREFIRLNAAAITGAALAPTTADGSEPARRQSAATASHDLSPGFYRFAVGHAELAVLGDGSMLIPSAIPSVDLEVAELIAHNVEPETREEYLRSRLVPSGDIALPLSPVLIDSGGRTVLVDSGWDGEGAPPTTDRLALSLEAAGVSADSADSIDAVVLTQAHLDHLGGLLHPTTVLPRFPNAEVVLTGVELELWTGDDTAVSDSPFLQGAQRILQGAQRILSALEDRIRTIPSPSARKSSAGYGAFRLPDTRQAISPCGWRPGRTTFCWSAMPSPTST